MHQVPVLSHYEYQKAVIEFKSQPPADPKKGERYIISTPGIGEWQNKENQLAEYNGFDWIYTLPRKGTLSFVKSEDCYFGYSERWSPFILDRQKYKVTELSDLTYTINVKESGTILVNTVDSGEVEYILPDGTPEIVGICYLFVNNSASCKLKIKAGNNDTISDSGAGCYVFNEATQQSLNSLQLVLISEHKWAIVYGNGVWKTTTI